MSRATPASPLWIAPVESAVRSACASCLPPAPRLAATDEPVQLLGDPRAAARVLQALRAVRDPENGRDLVDAGWVHAMRVDADEAELTLQSRTVGCSVARGLAEDAFAVLRRELPDTDLYVRHVRLGAGAADGRQCLHPPLQVEHD